MLWPILKTISKLQKLSSLITLRWKKPPQRHPAQNPLGSKCFLYKGYLLKKKNREGPLRQLIGTVRRQADGFGFVIPEDPTLPDVYLPRHQMQGVMNQDKVQVAVLPRKYRKNKFTGKVLKIMSKREELLVGQVFPLSDKTGLIKDDSAQWGEDLKVDLSQNHKVKKGEWVQAKVTHWPASPQGFKGKFVCSLGTFPNAEEDNMRVIQKHNLPVVFSKESLKESNSLKETKTLSPTATDKKVPTKRFSSFFQKQKKTKSQPARRDLRALPFVTIDGKTAQDFDDAIYVHSHPKGWVLYVAIADVSHYVPLGSALDKTAKERGNSVYFPGWTVPMLPEKLSNDLCSLKPHVPRLAFVAEMHFNQRAKREKSLFYEGLIQSQARLTYGETQDIIELNWAASPTVSFEQGHKKNEAYNKEVVQNIVSAGQLAQKRLQERLKNYFINLEIPETEVHLNAIGEPVDITQSQRLFAHQLIEEFMLSANQAVAEYLSKHKVPALYRTHDPPKEDSIKLLEKFAQSLGFKAQFKGLSTQKDISLLIEHFAQHPLSEVLQMLVLRSLSQAVYSAQNKGHFGLNLKHYTHFTSPIRRYSDLIVHRALKACLFKESWPYPQKALESLAPIISACEQRAVKAERFLKDIKKVRFIRKHLGEEMEGRIAGLTRFGFFVRLRLYDVEGLVSASQLGGQWEFEESLLELRSTFSHRRFKMGDLVVVQVVSANIETAQIDFELKEHKGEKLRLNQKKNQRKRPLKGKKTKKSKAMGKSKRKARNSQQGYLNRRKSKKSSKNARWRQRRRRKN